MATFRLGEERIKHVALAATAIFAVFALLYF